MAATGSAYSYSMVQQQQQQAAACAVPQGVPPYATPAWVQVSSEQVPLAPQREAIAMNGPMVQGNSGRSGFGFSGVSNNAGTTSVLKKMPTNEVKLQTITEVQTVPPPGSDSVTVNTYQQQPPSGIPIPAANPAHAGAAIGDMGLMYQQQQAYEYQREMERSVMVEQQQQQQQQQLVQQIPKQIFSVTAKNAQSKKTVVFRWETTLREMAKNPDMSRCILDSIKIFCKHQKVRGELVSAALGDLETAMITEMRLMKVWHNFPVSLGLKIKHAKGTVYTSTGKRYCHEADPYESESFGPKGVRIFKPSKKLASDIVANFAGVTKKSILESFVVDTSDRNFCLVRENSPIIHAFLQTVGEHGIPFTDLQPIHNTKENIVTYQIASGMVEGLVEWCEQNILKHLPYTDLRNFGASIRRTDIVSPKDFASVRGDLAGKDEEEINRLLDEICVYKAKARVRYFHGKPSPTM